MEQMLDHLVVKLSAEAGDLTTAIDQAAGGLADLQGAGELLAGGLTQSFDVMASQGRLSFDSLQSAALQSLESIGVAFIESGVEQMFGQSSGGQLLGGIATGVLGGLLGRAGGGAVSSGQPYVVGERGPELFVPHSGGQVVPAGSEGRGGEKARNINITINMAGNGAGSSAAGGYDSGRGSVQALHQAMMRATRDL